MSFQRLDIYDNGRLRLYEHWRIYALFCMQSPTSAFVKIGVSSIIYDRLLTLQPGLLFPIGVCLHAPVGERGVTMVLESAIHKEFADRNTRGEWFAFNMEDKDDKEHFHSVTKALYLRYAGKELKWDKITPGQLAAYSTYRKKKHKKAA